MAKKKNKPNNTVNVDLVKKESHRLAKQHELESGRKNTVNLGGKDFGELSPGSVRRESPLEQEMGSSKYKEMIHRHNDQKKHILDRLPFQFPRKRVVRSHLNVVIACADCGYQTTGSENTVGFTCPDCKTYVKAINPEAESRGYNSEAKAGIFGSASDLLSARESLKEEKEG